MAQDHLKTPPGLKKGHDMTNKQQKSKTKSRVDREMALKGHPHVSGKIEGAHVHSSWATLILLLIQTLTKEGSYLFPHLGWIAARAQTGGIGPIGPPRKIHMFSNMFFDFFGPWKK